MADKLGLSRRSLQCRLGECGDTFYGLLEQTRKQLAQRYLQSSNYTLTEVAFMLGYSESSTFIRAFRRWNGQPPQQFRLSGWVPAGVVG
ncbi:MAG: helix-turn-helix transcriptional regulator [Halopseudomonas sp.]